MIRKFTALFLCALVSTAIFAYEGDYVWEDKFNRQLPKAQKGDSKAQYDIGEMYDRGNGKAKNKTEAFAWYSRSASQGHTKAAYKVGYAYLKGIGVKANSGKALKWMTLASNKGYVRAHYGLGQMYEKGIGITRDYDLALKWYKKALKGGYSKAQERIREVTTSAAKMEKNKRRLEIAAARKQLNSKAKVRPVSMPAPPLTIRQVLLQGDWKKKKKPAESLPSSVSECTETGRSIECISRSLQRNIGMADIRYQTKAVLFSIKDTGEFKIKYRNNVLDINITDPDFLASGAKVPVSLGWQDAEHSLVCKISNNNKEITCKKNKTRTVKYHR